MVKHLIQKSVVSLYSHGNLIEKLSPYVASSCSINQNMRNATLAFVPHFSLQFGVVKSAAIKLTSDELNLKKADDVYVVLIFAHRKRAPFAENWLTSLDKDFPRAHFPERRRGSLLLLTRWK